VNVLNVVELFEEGAAARSERPPDPEDAHARIKSAALDRLRNAIRRRVRARCSIKELVAVGRPCREILRVAAEERCELIVLGVESRSPADLMLFGSTTQHVVRRAACPVLTIRA
jgi:nucleotide-binding universal stress UspA family protein